MVSMLKSAENGMEERETAIKEQLKKIAILEMEKGKDEDEMLDQTLKAVEMINIADIASERESLQADCDLLMTKKLELEKVEDDMHKEKLKEKFKDKGKRDTRR